MYREFVLVLTIAVVCAAVAIKWLVVRNRERRREAEFEQHGITPEQLSQALAQRPRLPLFDIREPLDVPANSEVIPGTTRICPYRVLENPWLIPRGQEVVIYCMRSTDEINVIVLERLLAIGFLKVKFLKGGLDAWKAAGFPVDCYQSFFRLNVAG